VFTEPLPINGFTCYNILLETFIATVRNEAFSAAQPCRDGDSITLMMDGENLRNIRH
jgi:hypothetical protein